MDEPRRGATSACPSEVCDADRRARRRAVGGERGDDLLVGQPLGGEIVGDLAGQQAEGGVELVGGDVAEHVGGDALAEADLDARMGAAEAGEQAGDVEVAGGQERPDPDAPAQDAAELVDLLARGVDLGKDPACTRRDGAARVRRNHAAARAFEQRRSQLLLEPPDLVRQCRLGEVELLGGAREVAVPRHRLHASQLPELHGNDRRTRSLR